MWYASLVKSLIGIYYPIEAASENEARLKISTSSLKELWCSVYHADKTDELIAAYGGIKLPDGYAKHLDFDSFAVSQSLLRS